MNKLCSSREINLSKESILVIGAHPDDVDFMCAGTAAKANNQGCEIDFLIVTNGCKGAPYKREMERFVKVRQKEQLDSSKVLGARNVYFLGLEDGALKIDDCLLEKIVYYIRKLKPSIIITHDPALYFHHIALINHRDHSIVGSIVLDAVFPKSQNIHFFPEHFERGMEPHKIDMILLATLDPAKANGYVDISNYLDKRLKAIACHRSQFKCIDRAMKATSEYAKRFGEAYGISAAELFIILDLNATYHPMKDG